MCTSNTSYGYNVYNTIFGNVSPVTVHVHCCPHCITFNYDLVFHLSQVEWTKSTRFSAACYNVNYHYIYRMHVYIFLYLGMLQT